MAGSSTPKLVVPGLQVWNDGCVPAAAVQLLHYLRTAYCPYYDHCPSLTRII